MNKTVETIIKLVLAGMLFLCLADMPYSYFEIMRLVCITGFGMLAFKSFKDGNEYTAILYCGLVLLFQPFAKVHIGREMWNVIDIIVGGGLVISIFLKKKKA